MTKDKKEDIYYCFRYKCKTCPKKLKCDEELKKDKKQTCKNRR